MSGCRFMRSSVDQLTLQFGTKSPFHNIKNRRSDKLGHIRINQIGEPLDGDLCVLE